MIRKNFIRTGLAAGLLAAWLGGSLAAAELNKPAPDFSAVDSKGKVHELKKLKGLYVVLEWHNQDCPFVRSQYAKGKMQKLQEKWVGRGVQWFTVISSAPGKEGYVDADGANQDAKKNKAHVTATLLDPKGKLGRAYGAKTTPHMFVIDPKGDLIYDGAIDNAPLEDAIEAKTGDGQPYVNYVDKALTQSKAGQKVSDPAMAPYGCHVKY
ncbi:MAG TPA: redoxin domain-containing protein [bacterium]|nr:redoxin domain-containing protein [bacterium]